MQLKIFTGIVLLMSSIHLGAQQHHCNYIFSGKITDQKNQPLIGAGIQLSGHNGQAADTGGNFRFTELCEGEYTVKVQHLGYRDTEFKIVISGDVVRTISLAEVATQLNEVVIHHDAFHTEHVNNYVQMDDAQVAEQAGKTLGAMLKELPGVNSIQTGPGIFKPVIHGMHSQRILILNHGIKQESQQWGAEHAPEIDPMMASNIIVVKDASSIKYGTGALGGVIVVNPKPLPEKDDISGMLNSVLQSNGRSGMFSGMLEGGIPQASGWGWRVQGTIKKSGDFTTPDYVLTNTGLREINFSATTGYHKERSGLDIFFSHFQTELGILKGTSVNSLDDLVAAMESKVPAYTTGFSYHISEPRQEVIHNLLKINGHSETRGGEWRWQYGFQNNHRKEFDLRFSGLSDIPSMNLQLDTHSADIGWETHHSEKRTVSFGVNGIYQQNKNIPGTQRIPFIPNFTNVSAGLYGVSKFYFASGVADLGVRVDHTQYYAKGFDVTNEYYSTDFNFSSVSASAGITKQLSHNQSLMLNLSTSWRPPHVSELFSSGKHQSAGAIEYGLLLNDSTNRVMDISDSNFEAERAFKLVSTWQWRMDRVTLELGPYANYVLNYINLQPSGITRSFSGVYPYFRYRQTDALFAGLDAIMNWHAGKFFTVTMQASLLRVRDVKNHDPLPFISPNRYAAILRYERPLSGATKSFYMEAKGEYVSRQSYAPRVLTVRALKEAMEEERDLFAVDRSVFDFAQAPDGYFLLNMAAGISIKNPKVRYDIRLASDNLLNEQYRDYTNRFRYYADEVGRNILLSLKCAF